MERKEHCSCSGVRVVPSDLENPGERYAEFYEIQSNARSENYFSICSDSQAALKALQAAKTTSPLVWQCQKVLNDISTYHSVGLFWVPGHSGIRGNEIADELAREGSVHHFVGPEPALGVSRQNIKKKIQCSLLETLDINHCAVSVSVPFRAIGLLPSDRPWFNWAAFYW